MSTFLTTITTVFSYFHPSKAPYLVIAVTGTIASVFASSGDQGILLSHERWCSVIIPSTVVMLVCVFQSFASTDAYLRGEYTAQMRISRSLAVSVALGTLAYSTHAIARSDVFWLLYACCLIQIPLFLLFSYIFRSGDDQHDFGSLVEVTTMGSLFLAASAYTASHYGVTLGLVPSVPMDSAEIDDVMRSIQEITKENSKLLAVSARCGVLTIVFLLFWTICTFKVASIIKRFIHIEPFHPTASQIGDDDTGGRREGATP